MDTETSSISVGDLTFSTIEAGPPDGDVVLCLHGFPDNAASFRHQVAALAGAGHRVIAPTMRGYEPSSQPTTDDYSLMAMAGDVVGWMDVRGIDRVHLVGHDWGAAVAYVVAAHHPERFRTLTTMAVPPLTRIPDAVRRVPRQIQRSWYMTFFQLRWVADRALATGDWALLRRLWSSWSPDYELSAGEWAELRAQFEAPGVVGASLAYYRQNATPPLLLGITSNPAMEQSVIDVPSLVIHGARDRCMDLRLFGHTVLEEDFPRGVRVEELPDAGHFLHLERPDDVNALLLEHLA